MDPRVLKGRETNVVDAYESGQSVEEIAARNGCSIDPVQRVLQRAGVEPPLLPNPLEGHESAVAAAYVSGTSVDQLARRYGATARSIRRALAAEGLAPPQA
jgi:uncharacterized protein (DUF433 family)